MPFFPLSSVRFIVQIYTQHKHIIGVYFEKHSSGFSEEFGSFLEFSELNETVLCC